MAQREEGLYAIVQHKQYRDKLLLTYMQMRLHEPDYEVKGVEFLPDWLSDDVVVGVRVMCFRRTPGGARLKYNAHIIFEHNKFNERATDAEICDALTMQVKLHDCDANSPR